MKARISLSTKGSDVTLQVVPALRPSNAAALLEVLDLSEGTQRGTRVEALGVEDGRCLYEVTVEPEDDGETRAQVLGFVLRRLAAHGIPWELTDASS